MKYDANKSLFQTQKIICLFNIMAVAMATYQCANHKLKVFELLLNLINCIYLLKFSIDMSVNRWN